MYLLLAIGFSSKGFRNFSFKSVANEIAYGGANIVPNGVSRISLKSFSSNFKTLFFSTTSASSIIMSPEFSLLSFHYGIDEKNLSCLGLPHARLYRRVVYMLSANNVLYVPSNYSKFIVRTFLNNVGIIFQILQQVLLSLKR